MMETSSTNSPENRSFMLAGATIEPLLNLIRRDGQHFQVERQVMLLLLFLVENVDQVVTRESLLESLWEKSIPKDEALTQAVSKLRKALGDCPKSGRGIQTIRKVGYRLIGPVSHVSGPTLDSVKEPERSPLNRSHKKWAVATWVAITLFGIASLLNIVTVRAIDSGDASPTHRATMVRMIISGDHEQLPTDMAHPIDQNETDAIEQVKTADQP